MEDISCIVPHTGNVENLRELFKNYNIEFKVEIIFVFDGCENHIEEFEALFPFAIHAATKVSGSGAGRARNIGLKLASRKFIIFADADDIIDWEDLFSFWNSSDLNGDLIMFPPRARKLNGHHSHRADRYIECLNDYQLTGSKEALVGFVVPWSKIYRKSLIDRHEIKFQEVVASNDVYFSVKYLHHARFIKLFNYSYYTVIEHPGSLTKRRDKVTAVARLLVLFEINEFLKRFGYSTNFIVTGRLVELCLVSPTLAIGYFVQAIYRRQPVLVKKRHLIKLYKIIFGTQN